MSATADPAQNPADDGGHHDAHGEHGHDPNLAHHFDTMEQQFESGKLGMWVFLATEILMFGGLFCAYAIYRGNNPEIFLFAHQALDTNMGAINTVVLLASSFTMAVGVKAASQGRQALLLSMLVITFLGGVGFMTIKSMEYVAKWDKGLWIGDKNVFYANAEGFESAEAKQKKEDSTIQYIESHGHGDGHGGDASHDAPAAHGGDAAHAGDHSDAPLEMTDRRAGVPGGTPGEVHDGPVAENAAVGGHADAPVTEDPAEVAAGRPGENAAVQPGNTTGVGLAEDHGSGSSPAPGPDAADVVTQPAPVLGGTPSWPPVPADHMVLPAPVNLAAATNEPFLNAAPEVGVIEGMVSGSAEVQAKELAGPKQYPGFHSLSPLDQERTHIFFQIYFVMTGLHGLHVLIGMGLIFWVTVAAIKTPFGPAYYAPVDIVGLYWHLVDLIWIFLFPLLYLIH
ncbi:cytochrome c oxidase subunit 3 [Phycisphaera mikurensis]|uniref:Putative cytochrome c oxidase subunit III n=1 Tax=Phycisphaera mikurensis (strain NBRC 102666 / KCTC 22515 / FYK2301M01) TaxID=1142394 RepID=I0IIL7_PHYMF|nr:cytochrome c oxidase subunit 3 [Phycisphaera mikurensis]MBB6442743.1 cytochrome c oxidase subunit 3 [Phycisphaera mikurensis]BAM05105.1 putative cytochrome c oxidase subunit III [Phycisphaera mikurensis NBRC 102666]